MRDRLAALLLDGAAAILGGLFGGALIALALHLAGL